jgi:hypothetical protein
MTAPPQPRQDVPLSPHVSAPVRSAPPAGVRNRHGDGGVCIRLPDFRLMEARRRLAVVRDYPSLIDALKKRIDELETSYDSVDQLAGLPVHYVSKLLGPSAGRSLGKISFGPIMQVLGIELVVQENLDGYERIRNRLEKRRWARKNKIPASGIPARRTRRKYSSPFRGCSSWGRLMRARQLATSSPEQRSAAARHAIQCRWERARMAVAVPEPDAVVPQAGQQQ